MHSMNTANITEGGFVGSDMWKTTIPLYNTAFGSILGSHLLSHRTLLTNTVNANLVSNAGLVLVILVLLVVVRGLIQNLVSYLKFKYMEVM